eukprot:tig00001127_g7157.t1
MRAVVNSTAGRWSGAIGARLGACPGPLCITRPLLSAADLNVAGEVPKPIDGPVAGGGGGASPGRAAGIAIGTLVAAAVAVALAVLAVRVYRARRAADVVEV